MEFTLPLLTVQTMNVFSGLGPLVNPDDPPTVKVKLADADGKGSFLLSPSHADLAPLYARADVAAAWAVLLEQRPKELVTLVVAFGGEGACGEALMTTTANLARGYFAPLGFVGVERFVQSINADCTLDYVLSLFFRLLNDQDLSAEEPVGRCLTVFKGRLVVRRSGSELKWTMNRQDFLGEGSFGKVYAGSGSHSGSQSADARRAAIKFIRLDRVVDKSTISNVSSFIARLMREVQVPSRVNHPGVVNYIDHLLIMPREGLPWDMQPQNWVGGYLVLVSELVQGVDLLNEFNRTGSVLPLDDLRSALSQVGKTLLFLHRLKPHIIHRDMKPDNLLYSKDDVSGAVTCKIADFGLSRFIGSTASQQASTVVGTVQFMPPEMDSRAFSSSQHGVAADAFSFGMTLAVLLGGSYPYRNRLDPPNWDIVMDASASTTRWVNDRGRYWSAVFQGAGPGIEEIVSGLLKAKPEERMTLCEAMGKPWWGRWALTSEEDEAIAAHAAETTSRHAFLDLSPESQRLLDDIEMDIDQEFINALLS